MHHRLLLIFMLVLGFQGACATPEFQATPITLTDQVSVGQVYQGIRLLGALRLNDVQSDDLPLCGLSGLAWDEDAGLLYAISDQGALFHLRPEFDASGMLSGVQWVAAYPLRDELDQPLRSPSSDAEGLAIRNGDNGKPDDAELLISFEDKPRLVRYSLTGLWKGEERLPAPLRDLRNYRNPNQALEAVTLDPRWGVLTGTEAPLRNDPDSQIRLFRLDGRFWRYPLSSAPNSALVAMEALPDGGLLTLERAFVAPLRPLIISLRRVMLPAADTAEPLLVRDVAVFDSSQGWLLDNFEGLTRYRGQRFFMVSDDNCKFWQTTLLVEFELLPDRSAAFTPSW